MVLFAPRVLTAPPVSPLPYGLLSVADVRLGDQARVLFGTRMLTDNCVLALDGPEFCPEDPADPKEITDGQFVNDGVTFTGYSLMRCRTVGTDLNDERAARVLSLSEARLIEAGFMREYLASGTVAPPGPGDPAAPSYTAAVDLTPAGGAVCPELGLALLEGYAARTYGGIPVVHVARTVGSLLGTRQAILRNSNRLESVQGAWIASGGGYDGPLNLGPTGVAPAAGESWMYVTGSVVVERGRIINSGPVLVTAAALEPPVEGGYYVNEFDRFVERGYGVTADCLKAAVRVTIDCGEVAP